MDEDRVAAGDDCIPNYTRIRVDEIAKAAVDEAESKDVSRFEVLQAFEEEFGGQFGEINDGVTLLVARHLLALHALRPLVVQRQSRRFVLERLFIIAHVSRHLRGLHEQITIGKVLPQLPGRGRSPRGAATNESATRPAVAQPPQLLVLSKTRHIKVTIPSSSLVLVFSFSKNLSEAVTGSLASSCVTASTSGTRNACIRLEQCRTIEHYLPLLL